jgi:hypothetical protein
VYDLSEGNVVGRCKRMNGFFIVAETSEICFIFFEFVICG